MSTDLPDACRQLTELQSGILSRRQALDGGLPPDVIDRRLRSGRWQTVQRGVYAVFTGQPSRDAVLWAAVHRGGPGAALSHRTAAELFGLAGPANSPIHLTIPVDRRASAIRGVVVHRSSRLAAAIHPSLLPPRTRIEETVLDLADQAPSFEAAFDWACQACQRRLTVPDRIAEAMSQRARLRWRTELARALSDVAEGAHSLLEYRYVHRVERPHGLPTATRQVRLIEGRRHRYLDNLYGDSGVSVELDGQQAHPDYQRWNDQHRMNAVAEQGITTLRYGWTDIDQRPCQVAAQIAAVLRSRGWSGTARACGPACSGRRPSARAKVS
jgi:very-short-patch-repair endonuclease